jgi:hypothetical protein
MIQISHVLLLDSYEKILEETGVKFEYPVKAGNFRRVGLDGEQNVFSPFSLFDFIGEIAVTGFIGFFNLDSVGGKVGKQFLAARLVLVFFQGEDDR